MTILLAAKVEKDGNQYISELVNAYQHAGHSVLVGVQNFLISDFKPDVLHIQWPEAIYFWEMKAPKNQSTFDFIESRLKFYHHTAKTVIVLTFHNLMPHESKGDFDFKMYQLFIKYADVIVHHGKRSVDECLKVFPELSSKKNIVCPHGAYPVFEIKKEDARKKLGLPLDKTVILNFGRIREYKGVDFIEAVLNKWRQKNVVMYVAGFKHPTKLYQKALLLLRIRLQKYLNFGKLRRSYTNKVFTEQEVGVLLSACDIVFLGHSAGLNSGVVTLGASYKKPVVFPDLGNFSEQLIHWPWQASYLPGDVETARKALTDMVLKIAEENQTIPLSNEDWKNHNSWSSHASKIIETVAAVKSKV